MTISLDALHRLALAIVRQAADEDNDDISIAAVRESLADVAGNLDLDLQDTATLYRVASGEASGL